MVCRGAVHGEAACDCCADDGGASAQAAGEGFGEACEHSGADHGRSEDHGAEYEEDGGEHTEDASGGGEVVEGRVAGVERDAAPEGGEEVGGTSGDELRLEDEDAGGSEDGCGGEDDEGGDAQKDEEEGEDGDDEDPGSEVEDGAERAEQWS